MYIRPYFSLPVCLSVRSFIHRSAQWMGKGHHFSIGVMHLCPRLTNWKGLLWEYDWSKGYHFRMTAIDRSDRFSPQFFVWGGNCVDIILYWSTGRFYKRRMLSIDFIDFRQDLWLQPRKCVSLLIVLSRRKQYRLIATKSKPQPSLFLGRRVIRLDCCEQWF